MNVYIYMYQYIEVMVHCGISYTYYSKSATKSCTLALIISKNAFIIHICIFCAKSHNYIRLNLTYVCMYVCMYACMYVLYLAT